MLGLLLVTLSSLSWGEGITECCPSCCHGVSKTCIEPQPGCVSPIVIDTKGTGFEITDPKEEYVTFDIRGDGKPVAISWPKHGHGLAFLVYDRDGDGKVDSGKELFGNFTPQRSVMCPKNATTGEEVCEEPNGFRALQMFDMPSNGGNMDGVIDKRDKVWSKLKLWIDDHCYLVPTAPCSAYPEELHSLDSLGVHNISLAYEYTDKKDAVGNDLKFGAKINVEPDDWQKSHDGRMAYDVFFMLKK